MPCHAMPRRHARTRAACAASGSASCSNGPPLLDHQLTSKSAARPPHAARTTPSSLVLHPVEATSYELRAASCERQATSDKLRATSREPPATSHEDRAPRLRRSLAQLPAQGVAAEGNTTDTQDLGRNRRPVDCQRKRAATAAPASCVASLAIIDSKGYQPNTRLTHPTRTHARTHAHTFPHPQHPSLTHVLRAELRSARDFKPRNHFPAAARQVRELVFELLTSQQLGQLSSLEEHPPTDESARCTSDQDRTSQDRTEG